MNDDDGNGIELRLALAMRGGVSLAVWIGGACAEIDQLRHADPGNDDFWSRLLRQGGYRNVVVDVLAGASAGGLNGVLFAASQAYGFPFARMRDIWLRVGGTEGLVRRKDPYPSLFQGDAYFQAQLDEQLEQLARLGPAPETRPAVELTLPVTYVEPVERPVPSPADEQLIERRYASGFRFRQPSALSPWTHSNFPAVSDDPEFAAALRRLALAARATSSYPGAFEAATMCSSRPTAFGRPVEASASSWCEMDGTLLDRRATVTNGPADAANFVVSDGGILDNIPIDRAIDAIATAPAESQTDRLLIYLQPGALRPSKDAAQASLDRRRDTISVVRGAASTRLAGETINADIAAIEAYNNEVAQATSIRAGTFASIGDSGTLRQRAGQRWDDYRQTRACDDARNLFLLLSDPIGTLGDDPFPNQICGQPVTDASWRSPLAPWTAAEREALPGQLVSTFTDMKAVKGNPFALGAKPLVRVTLLLIEWARYREQLVTGPARDCVSHRKRDLYRTIDLVREAVDRPRSLAWVTAAVAAGPDARAADFASRTAASVDRLCAFRKGTVTAVVDALLHNERDALVQARDDALDRIVGVATGRDWAQPGDDVRLRIVSEVLVPIIAEINGIPPTEPEPTGGSPTTHLDRMLRDIVDPRDAMAVRTLGALEVMCFAEFAAGRPGRRPIEFVRMSSANRTALAPAFTRVLEVAANRGLWWDECTDPTKQEGIHVELKLAGNKLANFSAFLVPEWRANDWLWGRLDAVPTLVDKLVQPASLKGVPVETLDAALFPPDHPWRTVFDDSAYAAKVVQAHEEASRLASLEGDALNRAPIPTIRDALVAQRQWAILTEELALPQAPTGTADADTAPATTWKKIHEGHFGSDTMRESAYKGALRERFDELGHAVGNAVVWNIDAYRGRALNQRLANWVRWGVVNGARLGVRRFLFGAKTSMSKMAKVAIGVVVVAALALGVAGFFVDKVAFLIGLGLGLAVTLVLAGLVWLKVRPVFREPRPLTSDPTTG